MIGFQQIAGGAPSSVGAMTQHLLTQTVSREQSSIAEYYAKGAVRDSLMLDMAHAMAAGELAWAEATDIVVEQMMKDIPPPTPEEQAKYQVWNDREKRWELTRDLQEEWEQNRVAVEGRVSYRLDVLASRIEDGLDPPVAVLRPDINPLVMVGLGIAPDGLLSDDEINALLAGRRADGATIESKKYAVERQLPVDPKTGERKWSTPIGSYDFCPTPDKSVSVAWAFAPEVEQAQIFNAHIEAAREAVGYIAEEIGQARLGKGGEEGFEPGHVAWLEFTHHTTRRTMVTVENGDVKIDKDKGIAGDPDLHTHFLMPNAVFCDSGRVGSLDTMAIKGFIFEADAYYHARLGTKLREAGFEVGLDERTGAARMGVIPDHVRTLFSKRTNAGEAIARKFTADRAESWDDLSEDQRAERIKTATQSLDQRKYGKKDDVADFGEWRRQAAAVGWEPRSLQFIGPQLPELSLEERHRTAYEIGLPWLAEKLEHRSVVPHWDLRLAALRGLVQTGMDDLDDVKGITTIMREEGVKQYGEQTPIVWGKEEGKRYTSVTTALHESDEAEFVRLAQAAARDRSGAIPAGLLQQKMVASGLDFGDDHGKAQQRAIERMGQGGRFGVAVGTAGAGKTAMLTPLVASWKEQWRDVWGASLAWRQADDLADAGIDRQHVKAFSVLMKGIEAGDIKLTSNSVVAVDEWGLLGTRQALELLRAREKYGFSVVALGDDKQCGSIEAGAIIDLSRRALGAEQVPEILTTKRQQTEREKEIVGLLRAGRAAEALNMKRGDGTAEMAYGGREGVIRRVAALYAERLAATGIAPTISAPTNSDAHQIGEAVRLERRKLGLVGTDQHVVKATDGERDYSLRLAAGDRVRLFRSTRADMGYRMRKDGKKRDKVERSIGRNGSVLDVVSVNHEGVTLRAQDDRTGFVKWSAMPSKNGRTMLAYGDASTIHTSQGSTAEEHIFALPAGSQAVTGAAGYTASTRHRSVAYLVTSEAAERIAVRESRPINDAHDVTLDDKWANVAKNFVVQRKTDSALDMLERVQSLRRGTLKAFHQAVRPSDPQRPDGEAHVPEMVQRRRLDIVMERITRGIRYVREAYERLPGPTR